LLIPPHGSKSPTFYKDPEVIFFPYDVACDNRIRHFYSDGFLNPFKLHLEALN